MKIRINTVYVTYQGEANLHGIGKPVIFLRLQGCPIRCYKETMGILCDTPEALQRDDSYLQDVDAVLGKLIAIREETGVSYICLTGGDPLWQRKDALHYLFSVLQINKFEVSVETSGVIPVTQYLGYGNVSWVVDYKLKSAGVDLDYRKENYNLPEGSIVKFVVYDKNDLAEMLVVVNTNNFGDAQLVAGLYWGTQKLTYKELIDFLMEHKLFGKIGINFQTHKMAEFFDQNREIAVKTTVRTEI